MNVISGFSKMFDRAVYSVMPQTPAADPRLWKTGWNESRGIPEGGEPDRAWKV